MRIKYDKWVILFLLLISCSISYSKRPKHIHLSLSSSDFQMNVAWFTDENLQISRVEYGTDEENLSEEIPAISTKLSYGDGYLHRATMTNLLSKTQYYYRVGDGTVWSKKYHFMSKPDELKLNPKDKVKILAYGDMGVFPNSLDSAKTIANREVSNGETDFVLHVGDLAYAFGNFTKWDMWFEATQSIAAYIPYMICTGNRDEEEIIQERFTMPSDKAESTSILKPQKKQNFYYSFDYDWVHVIAISNIDKYDKYDKDSDQYKWIESDLKQASSRVNNPSDNLQWIVIIGHTPMYSSSNGHTGGNKLLKEHIEHLLVKYNVTLGVWGDDHVYERTYPVFNDKPLKEHKMEKTQQFVQPGLPIHLLVGTSGIELDGWLSETPPDWSAYREKVHGYVRLEVSRSSLNVKFIRQSDGSVADEFVILKNVSQSSSISWFLFMIPILIGVVVVGKRYRLFSPTPTVPGESKNT